MVEEAGDFLMMTCQERDSRRGQGEEQKGLLAAEHAAGSGSHNRAVRKGCPDQWSQGSKNMCTHCYNKIKNKREIKTL